jgi:hypothetical protein
MSKRISLAAVLATAGATLGALLVPVSAQPARADYAPASNDVVGVGSAALSYVMDFGADGDPSGDTGFNSAGHPYKLVSFNASSDANNREMFLNDSVPMTPTVVYRGQTYPVQRVDGDFAGAGALLNDSASDNLNFLEHFGQVPDFVEASYQVFTLGTESLQIAADTTTNAPAGLSGQQLLAIYQCTDTKWTQVGGSSSSTIVPVLPPAGTDIYTLFVNYLDSLDNGTVNLSKGCVVTGEENDPTGITGSSAPADTIEPFPTGLSDLWSGLSGDTAFGASSGIGYFHDPTVPYPGSSTALSLGIKLLTGTPSDGNPVYSAAEPLQIVYLWPSQTSATPWQPGGTLNWAQTLFCNPGGSTTPFFQTAAGKILIAEAGADPANQSCLASPGG